MSNRLAIIGVGSNVAPEQHVPTALTALLHKHGTLHLSSVVETAPVGMTDDSGVFWNLAVAIPTDAGPRELQAALHDAERAAGRDRDAPGQSWKARPLDLDLLFFTTGEPIADEAMPSEPWIRPLVIELLHHLGIADAPSGTPSGAIAMQIDARRLPAGPTTLHSDTP